VLDAFYWPNLSQTYMLRPREKYRPDVVVQRYFVSEPQPDKYYRHDASLYSMWNHFVEFCYKNNESNGEAVFRTIDITTRNRFTGRLRLVVFLELSQGRSLSSGGTSLAISMAMEQPAGGIGSGQQQVLSGMRGSGLGLTMSMSQQQPSQQYHHRDMTGASASAYPPIYRGPGSASSLGPPKSAHSASMFRDSQHEGQGDDRASDSSDSYSLPRDLYSHEMQAAAASSNTGAALSIGYHSGIVIVSMSSHEGGYHVISHHTENVAKLR